MKSTATTSQDRFAALFKMLSPPILPYPADLLGALQNLPDPCLLPSPWSTWLLINLTRYRGRQEWIEEVVQRYLPDAFPPSENLSEQEQPVTFDFSHTSFWPGVVELECGAGFGRTNKAASGEDLTFGLTDKTKGIFFPEAIPTAFAGIFPPSIIIRFQELHRSKHTFWYAFHDLEAAGLFDEIFFDERTAGFGVAPEGYRLSDTAVWNMSMVDRYCQRWENEQERLWHAAVIGDWLKAHEEAQRLGATDIIEVTRARAAIQRQERMQKAQRRIATGAPAQVDQCVLADLSLIP